MSPCGDSRSGQTGPTVYTLGGAENLTRHPRVSGQSFTFVMCLDKVVVEYSVGR